MLLRRRKRKTKQIAGRPERSCSSSYGNPNSMMSPQCMVCGSPVCKSLLLYYYTVSLVLLSSQKVSNQRPCTLRKPFSLVGLANTLRHCRCLFTKSETPRQQKPSAAGPHRAETHSSDRPCCSSCSKSTWAPRISSVLLWICWTTTLGSLK